MGQHDGFRVLLVNPPVTSFHREIPPLMRAAGGGWDHSKWSPLDLPIGLLQVAAGVRNLCSVRLLDCRTEDPVSVPCAHGEIIGTPAERIRERIEEYRPNLVGVACMFTPQEDNAVRIAEIAKEADRGIPVVFGGAHVSVAYENLIQHECCDCCVVGEGEETFGGLVKAMIAGRDPESVAGIVTKNKPAHRPRGYLERLDDLPFPAYDLADRAYFGPDVMMPIVTSRGCPFSCTFCSVHLSMGRTFRCQSPEYVLEHLKHCVERLGVRRFSFEDDNISLQKGRWNRILDLIIEAGLDIEWITRNGMRADSLDRKTLERMKRAGCSSMTIAVESGNQRVLDTIIKKKMSLGRVRDAMDIAHDIGLHQIAFYVVGFPGETIPEMRDTLDFAFDALEKYESFPVLFFATPLLGTELFEQCKRMGAIDEHAISARDWALATNLFGRPMIETEDFSLSDLRAIERDYLARLTTHYAGRWIA